MSMHWTYEQCEPDSDLRQGDILAPTAELRELFKGVHPHFCDAKYLGFMVQTQSCDLVRRNGVCSARYINVAAIRSLPEVLLSVLDTVCYEKIAEGVYSEKDKARAEALLERLFNQNERSLGLFYLYPDATTGLGQDALAFLRVSIALRAEHYDKIRRARRGRLRNDFANQLGWLTGYLYSRVGTPDWPADELKKKIKPYLSRQDSEGPVWLARHVLAHLKGSKIDVRGLSRGDLLKQVGVDIPSPKDVALARIMEIVRENMPDLDDTTAERLERSLRNDPGLMFTVK